MRWSAHKCQADPSPAAAVLPLWHRHHRRRLVCLQQRGHETAAHWPSCCTRARRKGLLECAAQSDDAGAAHKAEEGGVARAGLLIGCASMFSAALTRVAFSVLAIPLQAELGLSLPQMGVLQSIFLAGYVLGQLPAGALADSIGGARLVTAAMFWWSAASVLQVAVAHASRPFAALLAVRALMGLAQSAIMPSAAALARTCFPPAVRSRCTSSVYASFCFGTVAGLATAPVLAERLGWPSTFFSLGLVGMAAAAACAAFLLPRTASSQRQAEQQQAAPATDVRLELADFQNLALLCFTHSVISLQFFVLQSWTPSFIASLGGPSLSLSSVGLLSSLPWLATAVVGVLVGGWADDLQLRHGWSALRVRRAMHAVASGGTMLSLLPLAVPGINLSPFAATAALAAAVAFQGANYSGFHAHVPEVAGGSAGIVLSITNTCGILSGMLGTILTGLMAASPLGYGGVFATTIALQGASLAAWLTWARGRPLQLPSKWR